MPWCTIHIIYLFFAIDIRITNDKDCFTEERNSTRDAKPDEPVRNKNSVGRLTTGDDREHRVDDLCEIGTEKQLQVPPHLRAHPKHIQITLVSCQ